MTDLTATVQKQLTDILADAARATPENLAEIIDDAQWHGTGNDDDTAVGHYLAHHVTLATHRPVTVWLSYHTVIVLDLVTDAVLARGEITGGAADLHDLITEGNETFAHLHNTIAMEVAQERADGIAGEFSARVDAWHRLGTVLPDTFDADTALRTARLSDWNVRRSPLATTSRLRPKK